MDRLKKFLTDKKVSKSFKRAGTGHRLTEDTSKYASIQAGSMQRGASSQSQDRPETSVERIAAADVAAQAAYKRMNLGVKNETITQRNIRLRAMKELEEEERRAREQERNEERGALAQENRNEEIDVREFEHSNAINGVFFTCELLGDDIVLTKNEMKQNVEEFLRSQMHEDSVVASTLMLFSLNATDKRQTACETLQKYIQNVLEHPDEAKFRRIRLANKAFQDRVLAAKGGREFLEACGFEERMQPFNEGSSPEPFLVIEEAKASDIASLVQALDVLQTGQPVPIKLHRNPAIYYLESNQTLANPRLPADFFELSGSELKKEQASKTAEVEKLSTLRTREMRERDEVLRSYRYKYTLIRITFPNRYLIQGTFGCYEKIASIREFVQRYLAEVELPLFVLKDPISGNALEDEQKTINDMGLVPAAVLRFEWDPDVFAELNRQGQQVPYLSDHFMQEAEKFVAS